ncbi:MAG TPA: hypothetical protein VFM25_09445 [Verrucomicrobiae bacterium]|jgi:hypothetical protein|nr:hypothetical protein [Verrucomicrobiae bacterium]
MNPRFRAALWIVIGIDLVVLLFAIFPRAFAHVQSAARDLRSCWWLIFLFALGLWLLSGIGRTKK